jgi:phosphatidylserine/phosphatidylglycerophosphate/cardiolipin synthase-like enzyme
VLITALFLFVLLLGAFGFIDLVVVDNVLEPFLGMRVFMTTPYPDAADLSEGSTSSPQVEETTTGDWWEVYFTNPGSEDNYIETALIDYINAAQSTIHIASFEFNLDAVAESLIAAHERGVEVEWVTDDEFGIDADEEDGHGQFAMLEDAGIGVKDDHRGALMHDKFWIFDQSIVWTGSTNITVNGTLYNNNNVIVLKSKAAARIFENEFSEMWDDDAFGPTSPSTVSQQDIVVNGTKIAIRFGSEDEVATYLAELLGTAQSEIRFMAFSFTQDDMGGTILQRAEKGVDVAGIFEARGSETEYSELGAMYCDGLAVRQDGNPRIMHHKVLIIDRHIVVTGSFNFSNNADESNDENVVIVDNAEIAAAYLQEFDRLWAQATDPDPADFPCK